MGQSGYALLSVTAIVALLLALMMFAALRFAMAARHAKRHLRESGAETALLSAALQEAVGKLRAQGQAMSVRAQESEQLSGQIVASLTAGLLVVDRAGAVEILNPAGQRLLNVTGEAVGRDYRELLSAAPPLIEVITQGLSTGRVPRTVLAMPSTVPVTHLGISVSPLGSEENARGVICLFSDLTNVYELEEQLRLKEALARLGELTAGIAHEFRNGLATIHGYSRLINPSELPAAYRPYVDGIRQETEVLGQVVTNFLNFARPEQVSFSWVDLDKIAQRAADDLGRELPTGASVSLDGHFTPIQGDEVLLRQVFDNLIRNAAEACESASVKPSIVISGHVDERTCRVMVDDNGPGIPDKALDRVFTPFFTTRSRGTGLGLAIVQKIVVTHNGRVVAAKSPRGGASIQLTFPLPQLEEGEAVREA